MNMLYIKIVMIFMAMAGIWLFMVEPLRAGPKARIRLPGGEKYDKELLDKIKEMEIKRGKNYRARTKHLLAQGKPKYTNRLFLESSPYLLQHAHNPVNWYPWGDEAFEAAKKLNRPVLLSVGYSTCHWCHVMEEESFEDEEIAKYINENYIPVKVDREERPDIDGIYMAAVQAMTGSGGWPMTVWLTPDAKPFFGGTYFPARDGDRGAQMGFFTILKRIREFYDSQKDKIARSGEKLALIIQERLKPGQGMNMPGSFALKQAMRHYKLAFDEKNGGIKGSPKFPSSLPIRFLLRFYRRSGDIKAFEMAKLTLEKMADGGIYDHVGGGFHRYSVDEKWLVPHFEKMLYDNALLIMAYIEAWQAYADEKFKNIAIETLEYIKRDMTSPDGAFYSATDADSLSPEGDMEEGYYFTWDKEEVERLLGEDTAKIIKEYYGITYSGNFEGRNILNTTDKGLKIAGKLGLSKEDVKKIIDEAKIILFKEREKRSKPLRDEKILTAWNGLMISAHARAGLILGNEDYTKRAEKAANFILENLFKNNRLLRSYKDGVSKHNGYLDDYAFFIAALLDLYEATGNIKWFKKAVSLDKILEEKYEDKANGGFFMTSKDDKGLIARQKPSYDGAEPSGNSVMALNLFRLCEFTQKENYAKRGQRILKTFLGGNGENYMALSEMLIALDFYLDKPKEIVIVTPQNRKSDAGPFLERFGKIFLPNRILAITETGRQTEDVAKNIPVASMKSALYGSTTAYVCIRGACELPAKNPDIFEDQIKKVYNLE